MKKVFGKISHIFLRHLPLLVVISVALVIAFQNIDIHTQYAGWDNILAELNLPRYIHQVFFGAWINHQGLGAPAAQGQLSEIPRLPILFFLNLILPTNLIRYVFIFSMYFIGGVGMYFYLSTAWLYQKRTSVKNWLASLGGIFYLLHILTLQQFYISFEMFTVQFAFLPFLLLTIHVLTKKISARTLLLFIFVQFLIAPSGHTPTVFYLGVLFSLIYAFFLTFKNGFFKAILFSFFIGCITLFANAYWVLPNMYYTTHDAQYVQNSRDNELFGPESVWSVREAGTVTNFLKGTQYLFDWKDYSFADKQFQFIFNDWTNHLSNPVVSVFLEIFGVITVLGVVTILVDRKKGAKRWAILCMYLFCLAFIWIDLFPTHGIMDRLYQSPSFLEAFRNTFTKLSIIYSFVCIVLFIQAVEFATSFLKKKILVGAVIFALTSAIIFTAWPSFTGHFISTQLKVKFPEQYSEMFSYLQTRDKNLRVLELPQLSHAGWDYYDWQFLGKGNGYQGMGFYFFGMPQPVLDRDSDRWVETSDFFYHELKYAIDAQNVDQLQEIFTKYNVNLVIIDQTKIDPNRTHDYARDQHLVLAAGLHIVWRKDFLTVYERDSSKAQPDLLIPAKVSFISQTAARLRTDDAYHAEGDYVTVKDVNAPIIYPFAQLAEKQLNNTVFTPHGATITQTIPQGDYTAVVPGLETQTYTTPVAIHYENQVVSVTYPKISIFVGNNETVLPQLKDFSFSVNKKYAALIVLFNDTAIKVTDGQTVSPVVAFDTHHLLTIEYAEKPDTIVYTKAGAIDGTNMTVFPVSIAQPDWQALQQVTRIQTQSQNVLKIHSEFPIHTLDLQQNPSLNCSSPLRGSISTTAILGTKNIVYKANNFGVSCNGITFNDETSAYAYILHIVGKNQQGRGPKFFINYADSEVLPEDYLFQDAQFDNFVTLHPVSSDTTSKLFLNWETRSLGKESINELDTIQMMPFPLTQMSQIKLLRNTLYPSITSKVTIEKNIHLFNTVHLISYNCSSSKCFIGLNQSYDDGWLSIQIDKIGFLSHFRLNNWTNLWLVEGKGNIVVFYFPEIVSLFSLTILVLFSTIVCIRVLLRLKR